MAHPLQERMSPLRKGPGLRGRARPDPVLLIGLDYLHVTGYSFFRRAHVAGLTIRSEEDGNMVLFEDNGGGRSGRERRRCLGADCEIERRSGRDRRSGHDRRRSHTPRPKWFRERRKTFRVLSTGKFLQFT
jgi:hypothetical protein